jgi:dienelactone hydrolase
MLSGTPLTAQGAKVIQLKGWLVKPKPRDRFGVVIIMHRCDELNLPGWNQALRWAQWFNEQGFCAFILGQLYRRGLISVCGWERFRHCLFRTGKRFHW